MGLRVKKKQKEIPCLPPLPPLSLSSRVVRLPRGTTTEQKVTRNCDRILLCRRHLQQRRSRYAKGLRQSSLTPSESKVSSKHLPGKIILQGENNLEVTPAIRAYVEEKLAKAVANADPRDVREIDCRVASRGGADHATKGAHICTTKATVLTRAGQIEVAEEHEDLYASDKVADGLKRQLRKFREA